MDIQAFLTKEVLLSLFLIIFIGISVGKLSIKGISLGTAGVLLTGLVFGHYGIKIPKEVMDIGLLLFVYSVGLQAGPQFFRAFRKRGYKFIIIAFSTILITFLATFGISKYLNLKFELGAGIFTGAVTNTPALASAIDMTNNANRGTSSLISVGYGIAYPFSVISATILVQLLPIILRRKVVDEEKRWEEENKDSTVLLYAKSYVVKNENCVNKSIKTLITEFHLPVTFSRIHRNKKTIVPHGEETLKLEDIVTVVSQEDVTSELATLLGPVSESVALTGGNITSTDIEVNKSEFIDIAIKNLHLHERFGVIITRVKKFGKEIAPNSETKLDYGDQIRVVGEREDVNAFVKQIGLKDHASDETSFIPYVIGIAVGICVGLIPFKFSELLSIKLGLAGGVFIAALIIGYYKKIGPLKFHIPTGANNFAKEIGIVLFLAGAGTNAGQQFLSILKQQGIGLIIAGAVITVVTMVFAIILMRFVFKMTLLEVAGGMGALMTNPPAIAAASRMTKTSIPIVTYANIFPFALIFKIIAVQLLILVLI